MRISHRWLEQYVDHGLTPEAVARTLTFQCCPIESVERLPSGDTALELEVTFNRPDLHSHLGVAREMAAATGREVREPALPPAVAAGAAAADLVAVEVREPDLCPRYTARVIEGVRVGPSPLWLAERLEAVGLRPVNNVVDVTNFVLYECGQPLHAFDLDRLAGRRIVVRRAAAEEAITAIDRTVHKLAPETLVIADAERPVAIAGIMGGLDTEIGEATTRVLLECAAFDPICIRRAVRRTGLRSDSSYRFERGTDPERLDWASRRAAHLIAEVTGGRLAAGSVDVDAGSAPRPQQVALRLARLGLVAGYDVPKDTAVRILERLGMQVEDRGGRLAVTVPTARAEVSREIDLIEEVLRLHGYDQVPDATSLPIAVAARDTRERAVRALKHALVGASYREVHTLSFVGTDPYDDPPLYSLAPARRVANPVRQETPALRRSLFGPLVTAKKTNLDLGAREVRLFEVSHAYLPRGAQGAAEVEERLMLGLLADDDLAGVKGALDHAAVALGLRGALRVEAVAGRWSRDAERRSPVQPADAAGVFDALEVGHVLLAKPGPGASRAPIGWVGRVSARLAAHHGLGRARPIVAILDLHPVLEDARLDRTYQAPSPFPAIARDLAIVVPSDAVYVGAILGEAEALRASEPALERVELLSVFEGDGKSLEAGRKSVAVRFVCQAGDRTLTGVEADAIRERAKARFVERFGASFRE